MRNLVIKMSLVVVMVLIIVPLVQAEISKDKKAQLVKIEKSRQTEFQKSVLLDNDNLIYQESFEFVDELEAFDVDGDGNAWFLTEDVSYDGNIGVAVKFNPTGNDDWLPTPVIQLPVKENIKLSLMAKSQDPLYLESFNARLSPTANPASLDEFSVILGQETAVPGEWTKYEYDVSAYAGQDIIFAVQCVSIDKYYLIIDDIKVYSVDETNDVIVSTTTGGKWGDRSTWEGGKLPSADDNVIINGDVVSNYTVMQCKNLVISETGTLRNTPDVTSSRMNVIGDFTNNGVFDNAALTYVYKDLINNGEWTTNKLYFSDTTMQTISGVSPINSLNLDVENKQKIKAGSDLTLQVRDITFHGSEFEIPFGLSVSFESWGGSSDNASQIIMSGGGSISGDDNFTFQYCSVSNLTLERKLQIKQTLDVGGSVVLNGILENYSGYQGSLNIQGNFINRGILRSHPDGGVMGVSVLKDFTNEGSCLASSLSINGTIDQIINVGSEFSSKIIMYVNVDGASSYNWFHNDVLVNTGNPFSISATEDYLGIYVCETDAGISRNITIQGVSSPLVADFEADKTSGNSPFIVRFTDLSSSGVNSRVWDFGDGNTSTEINPIHTYENVGVYSVSLTVGDGSESISEIKNDYITVTENQGDDYTIPLRLDAWDKVFSGPVEVIAEGLKINTTGYRNGNRIQSQQVFNLQSKNIYIKWLKHNNGSFMRGHFGIVNTEAIFSDIKNMNGDTWYYTRIYINADRRSSVVTCTGNYDNAGGTIADSKSLTVSAENAYNLENGNIYFYFDDTYQSTAYFTVGEVVIEGTAPTELRTQQKITFDEGVVPPEFTLKGNWSLDDGALYIEGNVDDSLSFTATNAALVRIKYKILHQGGDVGPDSETATSLMFYRNNSAAMWTSVYHSGRTSYASEWCYFTVPSNASGSTLFTLKFLTKNGQKLWIDEIELKETGPALLLADFKADVTSGEAPLTVQFSDASTGSPTSWAWDFYNDGTVDATTQNPSYTYNEAGSYTVKLTVTDGSNSDELVRTDYITVTEEGTINESENNDTAELANSFSLNSSVSGSIGIDADDSDWFSVTLPSDGHLIITGTPGPDVDIRISLYDNNGTTYLRGCSDCGGQGEQETTQFENLMAGTYYVEVLSAFGDGSYALNNEFIAAAYASDFEVNDEVQNALGMELNSSSKGHLGYYQNQYDDAFDWYRITVPSDGYLTLDVSPTEQLNVAVQLYDVDGVTRIKECTWCGASGENEQLKYENLAAGTYYILVGQSFGYGSYSFSNVFTPIEYPNDLELNNSSADAIPLYSGELNYGHLGYFGEGSLDSFDWYKFNVNEKSDLKLIATPTEALSIGIKIYDGNGSDALYDCTLCGGTGEIDEINVGELDPGFYYLLVSSNYGYGSYSISSIISKKEPDLLAGFNADISSGYAPLTVSFTDLSEGAPTSYLWEFGDGNTSTEINPIHTYETIGVHSVSLSVTNNFGSDVLTKSDYISVTKNETGIQAGDVGDYGFIFPNPSSGIITFDPGTSRGISNIEIRTLGGKLIENYSLKNVNQRTELDLSHLVKGMYLLNLVGDKSTVIQKLVVQ